MDETHEMRVFMSRLWTRRLYVIGGIAILVIGSAILAFGALGSSKAAESTNETFRFIALLVLFMAALATTATVFVGLRMGNAGEAFGLPAGSVRALLAIGIMILFVVFGLPFVTDPTAPVFQKVQVEASRLEETIAKYRADQLEARVLDYGRVARPASAGSPPTATAVAVPASPAITALDAVLLVSDPRGGRSTAQIDFGKQFSTAIITLLTTVIGFYFGSRSANDGMRAAEAQAASTASTDHEVQYKQLETRFEALKGDILARGQSLDQVATGTPPEDPAQQTERDMALNRAKASRDEILKQRDMIATHLTAAAAALRSLRVATQADIRHVHERDALNNLQQVATLLPALEQALPNYYALVDAAILSSAEG